MPDIGRFILVWVCFLVLLDDVVFIDVSTVPLVPSSSAPSRCTSSSPVGRTSILFRDSGTYSSVSIEYVVKLVAALSLMGMFATRSILVTMSLAPDCAANMMMKLLY